MCLSFQLFMVFVFDSLVVYVWIVTYYSEFSNQRALVERRARFHKIKYKKQFQQQFNSYISWISQAGTLCGTIFYGRKLSMYSPLVMDKC